MLTFSFCSPETSHSELSQDILDEWYEITFSDETMITNNFSMTDDSSVVITTTNIKLGLPQSAFDTKLHYRIYYDEA